MGIKSINEPDGPGRTTMVTPVSINEPPQLPTEMPDVEPVISGRMPNSCVIGSPDFTLFVAGTGFYQGSVIHFAGYDEPTTVNDDGTLSTGVKPSLWQNPDVVKVQVRNGTTLLSNEVDFTFSPQDQPEAAQHKSEADPDDLEDEIDAAAEDGDFQPMHPARRKR
jgi:hypothetical protein